MALIQRERILLFACIVMFVFGVDRITIQLLPTTNPLITFITIAITIDFVIAIPLIFYNQILKQFVANKPLPARCIRLIPAIFIGYCIVSYLIPNTNSNILTITRNQPKRFLHAVEQRLAQP